MDPKDRKGLERVFEEIATYEAIIQGLEAAPNEMTHLHLPLAKAVLWQHKKTVECIEEEKPLAATYFTNGPEIFTATLSNLKPESNHCLAWLQALRSTQLPISMI